MPHSSERCQASAQDSTLPLWAQSREAQAHLAGSGGFKYLWQGLGKSKVIVLQRHPKGCLQTLDGNCAGNETSQPHWSPQEALASSIFPVIDSHVAQGTLELPTKPSMSQKPRPTCTHFLSVGLTGVHYHTWFELGLHMSWASALPTKPQPSPGLKHLALDLSPSQ